VKLFKLGKVVVEVPWKREVNNGSETRDGDPLTLAPYLEYEHYELNATSWNHNPGTRLIRKTAEKQSVTIPACEPLRNKLYMFQPMIIRLSPVAIFT
jgi:hypothetical protein